MSSELKSLDGEYSGPSPADFERICREHKLLIEAIQTAEGPVAIYDDQDRLIAWNAGYQMIHQEAFDALGPLIDAGAVVYEDMLRISLQSLVSPDQLEAAIADRVTTHRAGTGELVDRYYHGKGWFRISKVRTSGGAVAGFAVNINELKETAASLASANQQIEATANAKSEFLASMSHEVRTPLGGIMGLARALAESDLSSEQQTQVDMILKAGASLKSLLNDSLDLAKIESGHMDIVAKAFSLTDLCEEVRDLHLPIAGERQLSLKCVIDPLTERRRIGDRTRIQQVLNNLVSNALKFTDDGAVVLTVKESADLGGVGDAILFAVADTGRGIDEDVLDAIFDKYSQTGSLARQSGGTGLGLAICRQIAELMDGKIWAERRPDGGSIFKCLLPLPKAAAEAPSVPVERPCSRPPPLRSEPVSILVAEDNQVNQFVVRSLLGKTGAELSVVNDGADALAHFTQRHFDVVLLDQNMPEMDGVTACTKMRAIEASTDRKPAYIVSLSANQMPDDILRMMDAGANDHLEKPIDYDKLLDVLAKV